MAIKAPKPKPAAMERGEAILSRIPEVAKGVEVGVFKGALSSFLLRHRPQLRLFMVDNWAQESAQPAAYRATRDYSAHLNADQVRENRQAARNVVQRFGPRAKILDMASVAAAKLIDDGSLDFVFLDADHSYRGVKADLQAWTPKVRPGGLMGGHDYRNVMEEYDFSGVDRAVEEWADGREIEAGLNFTWFCRL